MIDLWMVMVSKWFMKWVGLWYNEWFMSRASGDLFYGDWIYGSRKRSVWMKYGKYEIEYKWCK